MLEVVDIFILSLIHSDMAGGGALNQTKKLQISSDDQPSDSVFTSPPSKISLGSRAMLSFGGIPNGSVSSFIRSFDHEESGDEYLDEYFNQPEKKRRLSVDQVQFLERSFEAENKLEPERKIQLAKELGLQPRQISVWFQNRRARWKTRQLETDYETLHTKYKNLKTDYDTLVKENEKLKEEVLHLKHNDENLQLCDAKETSQELLKEAIEDVITENRESEVLANASKNEHRSSTIEAHDSSQFLGFEESDLSQNTEDDLSVELLQPGYTFPKIEDAYCHPSTSSFSYGFPIEDHAFNFWSY